MKTKYEDLAAMLAAIIMADGTYAEAEKTTYLSVLDALEVPEKEFEPYFQKAMAEVKDMDGDQLGAYVDLHAPKVDPEDIGPVYSCLMELALCDGELAASEVATLLNVGAAMELDAPTCVLMLCDLVKEEPELEVSFDLDEE